MKQIIADLPVWKRLPLWLANQSLFPTIIGAIGFAYIGIPSETQMLVRSKILPENWRELMLKHLSVADWTFYFFLLTLFFCFMGSSWRACY